MKTKIIALFTIFISFSISAFSQNGWDSYRKKLTDDYKYITFACIYGVDGQIYSAPAGAKTSPEEAKAILNVFANPGKAVKTGLYINKVKYTVAKADRTLIAGKMGNVWFEAMKTKKVILVAVGKDPAVADAVQKVGNWLLQNGS